MPFEWLALNLYNLLQKPMRPTSPRGNTTGAGGDHVGGQNDLKLCSRSKMTSPSKVTRLWSWKWLASSHWTASTATLVKRYRLDGHVICQSECRTHVGSFVWSILQIHETLKWDLQYEKAMMTNRLDRPATLKLRHVCLLEISNDKNDLDPMHNAGTHQIS